MSHYNFDAIFESLGELTELADLTELVELTDLAENYLLNLFINGTVLGKPMHIVLPLFSD